MCTAKLGEMVKRASLLVDRDERGASLVEYAFLLALIAIVCIAALAFMGESTNSHYSSVAQSVRIAGS